MLIWLSSHGFGEALIAIKYTGLSLEHYPVVGIKIMKHYGENSALMFQLIFQYPPWHSQSSLPSTLGVLATPRPFDSWLHLHVWSWNSFPSHYVHQDITTPGSRLSNRDMLVVPLFPLSTVPMCQARLPVHSTQTLLFSSCLHLVF